MTAFNVVRFRTKPGQEQAFIDKHLQVPRENYPGLRQAHLVRTGDRDFCFVGEWDGMAALAAARPAMIAQLDGFRSMLESLGEVGVTDPVSGDAIELFAAGSGGGRMARSA